MGLSGSKGYIAVGKQTNKTTPQTTGANLKYIEATASPFQTLDSSRVRRPTIGDSPLARGMYKIGTGVQGSVGLEVTSKSIGHFLYYLLGNATIGAADGNGLYPHTITMVSADKYSIPYFTLIRNVADGVKEMSVGSKMAEGALSFVAADAVQAGFTYMGLESQKFTGSLTPAYDTNPVMTMVNSNATFTIDIDGTDYTPAQIDVLGINVTIQNMITPPNSRYKIGSTRGIDLTLLDRAAMIEVVMEINDATIHDAITYSGNTWRESVAFGNFSVTAADTQANEHSLVFSSSRVAYSGSLVAQAPQQVVQATFRAAVLRDGSNDELKFVLTNDQSTAYSA